MTGTADTRGTGGGSPLARSGKPAAHRADRLARRVAWTLLAGSLAFVGITAAVGLVPGLRDWFGLGDVPAYSVGATIDVPRELIAGNARTLVVFTSADCGACVRSRPAIRALAMELRGSATHLLVLTPAARLPDQEAFVASLGLDPDQYRHVDLSALRLKSVPSEVLVTRAGRIVFVREGYIDGAGLMQIHQVLESLPV